LRILQISPYFPPYVGGSEGYCHQLSKRLAKEGHEVTVLTSRFHGDRRHDDSMDGFQVIRTLCLGETWGVNPATPILHKLLRERFDVIHAHSYIFFTSNQAALARKLSRTPLVLHLHGGIDAFPPIDDFSTKLRFHMKNKFYDPTIGRWTVRAADAVASVSKRDIELGKKRWGLNGANMYWVPNAIDPSDFDGYHADGGPNVIFIGRLEPWKGVRTLIDVARSVRSKRDDVVFTIVGDGSLRELVRNSLPEDYVKVIGLVPHQRIPEFLANSTVLVLPSFMEGMPTVCLEASAMKVPVVASDVGGTSEIVIHGENGYLFEPGNVRACTERILELLSDADLARNFGEKGRELAEKDYSWSGVVKKVEEIYERIT